MSTLHAGKNHTMPGTGRDVGDCRVPRGRLPFTCPAVAVLMLHVRLGPGSLRESLRVSLPLQVLYSRIRSGSAGTGASPLIVPPRAHSRG